MEALEQAIDRIDLLAHLKSIPNPGLAFSNLDALRGACREYIDLCSAATIEGFIAYLDEVKPEQAEGTGEHTVKVLTYHGAKGLEWPWVVLTGLGTAPRSEVFGVHSEAAQQFDPSNPLAGRKIRYWPWPLGKQKIYAELDARIDSLPYKADIQAEAKREAQRLLYVGMTRAKEGLVLAIRKQQDNLKTGWLDVLTGNDGESVIKWDIGSGGNILRIGKTDISIKTTEYDADDLGLPGLIADHEQYVPSWPVSIPDYPPARISPSGLGVTTDNIAYDILCNFKSRINIKGKPEMEALGSAVHAYLAVDYAGMAGEKRWKKAQRIIKGWGVETALDPAELLAAGQKLVDFINGQYPGCRVLKEWPISFRNDKNQLIQGWIDMLLETPEGWVIIDHKSYPGKDKDELLKEYAPQLCAYREAVEKATGMSVHKMLLHLPVSGLILNILVDRVNIPMC